MAELILELFSEEIPARMQAKAAADLERLFCAGLRRAGLAFGASRAFATPRRLTLHVADMARETEAVREELKGPRTDAPAQALDGFLRKTGLTRDRLETREDKKGAVFFAVIERPGRAARDVISELAPEVLGGFPWPKSMRWGAGDFRWVRPLRSILCVLADDDGAEVPAFEAGGVSSGDVTYGHRFLDRDRRSGAPRARQVASFAEYLAAMKAGKVTLDGAERAKAIDRGARRLAKAAGLELLEDPGLLRETAGLVEHPVPLMGRVAEPFQSLPPEVLQTSMREHQKFFALREPASGRVTRFVTVANIAAKDKGAAIIAGNERVLSARLADARFFYENDLARPLERRGEALARVTFHRRLGSQADRVARIAPLAREIAPATGAKPDLAARAAELAKADLVTEMVFEFPELQGVMGRYYAQAAGEPAAVADAIAEHYAPAGPSDAPPAGAVGRAVALADKLDTLAAFWAIGEKPTGSGDPFALRRAALGVIRIALETGARLPLPQLLAGHAARLAPHLTADPAAENGAAPADPPVFDAAAQSDLLAFFADRLRVFLRDQGARHDVIDAVFATMRPLSDLTLAKLKVDALGALLSTKTGADLQATVKRAANILAAEEKKDGVEYGLDPDVKFAREKEEKALFAAVAKAGDAIRPALAQEDFPAAMSAMARLRAPLDAFFDHVTVNAEVATLRRNRLCLLNQVRAVTAPIADFSLLDG